MSRLNFLKQYTSPNTIKAYHSALKNFFELIYNQREPLEPLAEKYFSEKRDYKEDMKNFASSIKNFAPKSVRLKISAIRIFLLENDVEIPQRFWRRLRGRIKGSRALTLDKIPSNIEFRKILTHIPVHGKALFLVLESSGMRIGEALQLKLDDIEIQEDPVRVNILGDYTTTGNSRFSFISKEAKETVGEWLKIRDKWLKSAVNKSTLYKKNSVDQRLFPFEFNTAYAMWYNALGKSGFKQRDKQTNRHKIHPHVLRKFFRTRMATVIPVDIVEALMGHEGYLTEVYRRHGPEDLANFYKEAEHTLLIFTESAELGKIRKEVEEGKNELQKLVNGLSTENLELRNRMAKLELEHTKLEKLRDEVEELKQLKETLQQLMK